MVKIATFREKRWIIGKYPHTRKFLNRKGLLYIATENESCIGFAFIQKRKMVNEPFLTEELILVIEVMREEWRRKGVASELIAKIKEDARARGRYQLIAYYQKENISSHKLWMKNGFGIAVERQAESGKITGCQAVFKL